MLSCVPTARLLATFGFLPEGEHFVAPPAGAPARALACSVSTALAGPVSSAGMGPEERRHALATSLKRKEDLAKERAATAAQAKADQDERRARDAGRVQMDSKRQAPAAANSGGGSMTTFKRCARGRAGAAGGRARREMRARRAPRDPAPPARSIGKELD